MFTGNVGVVPVNRNVHARGREAAMHAGVHVDVPLHVESHRNCCGKPSGAAWEQEGDQEMFLSVPWLPRLQGSHLQPSVSVNI